MIYESNNNNFFAFIAKASTTDVDAIDGAVLDPSGLADGDLVIVDGGNVVLDHNTALSGTQQFKFAQKAGGNIYYSPLVNFADATITAGKSTAAAQQVTTIGSNGTTTVGLAEFGVADDTAAAAAVGNSYYVLIEKQDNDEANRSGYQPAITAQAKLTNPDGFTNAELLHLRLAEQLRESLRVNDQLEAAKPSTKGPKYVRTEVIIKDDTTKATTTKNCVCVHGSKTINSHDGGNFASHAAGDYVILGEDVYKTTSAGGGASFTIEQPFAGASQTIAAGTSTSQAGFITVAEAIGLAGVGIRLTGTAQHEFDVTRERIHSESRFNVRFAKDGENVGAAITLGTAADEGLGNFETVASQEYHSFGNMGLRWVSDTPAQVRPANADSTKNYGCVAVREVSRKNNALIGQTVGQSTYNVWFELEADGTTEATANKIQETLRIQLGISNANLIDRA
tara:strand:+ start:539 stop:1894 length:1356 start_codon:yes stop_codon:yes gene_type:complete